MEKNFEKEKEELFSKIGKTYNMVLSTSDEGNVSSRMVSLISYNEKFYITSMKNREYDEKLKQMEENPNVALCADTMQIKGKAKILGSASDEKNNEIMMEYKNILPASFERFASNPAAMLIEIVPVQCKWWKSVQTMDGVIIDFTGKKAVSRV